MLQIQDQSLRTLPTAHLAQTMSLLVLGNAELRERVMQEMSGNPALELVDERVCPSCHRILKHNGPCPACSRSRQENEPIVFLSPRESSRNIRNDAFEEFLADQEPAAPENLALSVLEQLAADLKPDERKLAAYILSSLDDNGFLQDPPVYIARATRSAPAVVQHVLDLISHSDPAGLATSGPREALLVQLDIYPENKTTILARQILQDAFDLLSRRDNDCIAKKFDTSVSAVRKALAFIHDNLTPYPMSAYWGSGRTPSTPDPNVFHNPDILITRNPVDPDGPLIVEIFAAVSGWLRVNPLFKKVQSKNNQETSEEWSRHLDRASLFVKCLQQRNNTMRQLMEILVREQRKFIIAGDRELIPITRASLAERIGVHESTISRAVANKAIGLPDGRIISLSRFFDRSLSIRDRIKEIVRNENKPFTDEQIAALLKTEKIQVARRTVAKYRAIEGILPARMRHKRAVAGMRG